MSHGRRIETVERIIPIADDAGLKLSHVAMAFVIAHPGVTSAIAGPRTTEQLDDLLAGAGVTLSDNFLDRLDAVVPTGSHVGALDMAYQRPAIRNMAGGTPVD